jgi:phosphoribosylformylglycinamidine synthase
VPAREIGTTGGSGLAIDGIPELPLPALRTAWESTLPALFG